jgi:parallel beta-helix repeat protein
MRIAFLMSWLLTLPVCALPVVVVTRDDTVLTQSCRVVFPFPIEDVRGDGVVQVGADGITVEFEPATSLRGAPAGTEWDRFRGVGLRIDGRTNVTVRGAHIHGFFCGLVATGANGLRIEGGDFSDNYRQHLRSTPEAEDGADWLFPHHNEDRRWREEYGGAVCVERSRAVLIRGIRVRRGQNGILLDRVNDSQVYDNDASFLSGWGIALWRSSGNTISRNAFDFCVRGHSEGVYNRGQDSAGILCFEQSSGNVFAENSVTHGGDGFFGFAGQEALGEKWMEQERERLRRETGRQDVESLLRVPPELAREMSRRGCNSNLLIGNDFSYAPAHGIEMTFSEGNVFAKNRLVENGICGVWGGYSSDTWIVDNDFTGNGALGYGLERGAINMEHASDNRILGNRFTDNRVGVHLWWDEDGALLRLPGVAGNERGVRGNVIADNRFLSRAAPPFRLNGSADRMVFLQLRDAPPGGHVEGTIFTRNTTRIINPSNTTVQVVTPGIGVHAQGHVPAFRPLQPRVLGVTRPVGARVSLRGRDQILMDEWGPWDHEGAFVRAFAGRPTGPEWEVRGVRDLKARVITGDANVTVETPTNTAGQRVRLGTRPGLTEYAVELSGVGFQRVMRGRTLRTDWDTVFFSWRGGPDPRTNLPGWRALALEPAAVRVSVPQLRFPYGGRGPRDMGLSEELTRRGPGGERFGMIARTRLDLPAGDWKIQTSSDDGVRVRVEGQRVIENWNWHGPERNEGVFRRDVSGPVTIEVEHFEIDGHSELQVDLEREGTP